MYPSCLNGMRSPADCQKQAWKEGHKEVTGSVPLKVASLKEQGRVNLDNAKACMLLRSNVNMGVCRALRAHFGCHVL